MQNNVPQWYGDGGNLVARAGYVTLNASGSMWRPITIPGHEHAGAWAIPTDLEPVGGADPIASDQGEAWFSASTGGRRTAAGRRCACLGQPARWIRAVRIELVPLCGCGAGDAGRDETRWRHRDMVGTVLAEGAVNIYGVSKRQRRNGYGQ